MRDKGNSVVAKLIIAVVVTALIVGVGVYYAVKPAPEKEEGKFTFATMAKDLGCDWWKAYLAGGKWFLENKGHEVIVDDPAYSERKMNSILRTWADDPEIDAVIISGMGEGAIVSGVRAVKEAGKIIIITNCEGGYIPEVSLSIMFNSYKAGKDLAEKVVEDLTNKYGEPRGTIILSSCDPGDPDLIKRADGFRDVFDDYPEIEVEEIVQPGDRVAGAKIHTTTLLNQLPRVDAICSVEGEGTMGIVEALKGTDKHFKRGDPEHIVVAGIDLFPEFMGEVKEDYVDYIADQPVFAYNMLAAHYALKMLRGENVEFKVGQIITAGDILEEIQTKIPNVGVVVPDASWSPAEVVDVISEFGHLRIQTSCRVITPANIEEETLWANVAEQVTYWGM